MGKNRFSWSYPPRVNVTVQVRLTVELLCRCGSLSCCYAGRSCILTLPRPLAEHYAPQLLPVSEHTAASSTVSIETLRNGGKMATRLSHHCSGVHPLIFGRHGCRRTHGVSQ